MSPKRKRQEAKSARDRGRQKETKPHVELGQVLEPFIHIKGLIMLIESYSPRQPTLVPCMSPYTNKPISVASGLLGGYTIVKQEDSYVYRDRSKSVVAAAAVERMRLPCLSRNVTISTCGHHVLFHSTMIDNSDAGLFVATWVELPNCHRINDVPKLTWHYPRIIWCPTQRLFLVQDADRCFTVDPVQHCVDEIYSYGLEEHDHLHHYFLSLGNAPLLCEFGLVYTNKFNEIRLARPEKFAMETITIGYSKQGLHPLYRQWYTVDERYGGWLAHFLPDQIPNLVPQQGDSDFWLTTIDHSTDYIARLGLRPDADWAVDLRDVRVVCHDRELQLAHCLLIDGESYTVTERAREFYHWTIAHEPVFENMLQHMDEYSSRQKGRKSKDKKLAFHLNMASTTLEIRPSNTLVTIVFPDGHHVDLHRLELRAPTLPRNRWFFYSNRDTLAQLN